MNVDQHEPADTRSMGTVHSALRRDLERLRRTPETETYPDGKRRRALAEHIVWLMHALGAEAPWIVDCATPEDRDVILHVVPAVPRFIIMPTFGRIYRRKVARLWRDEPATAVSPIKVTAPRSEASTRRDPDSRHLAS